jgi:cyanophycinase
MKFVAAVGLSCRREVCSLGETLAVRRGGGEFWMTFTFATTGTVARRLMRRLSGWAAALAVSGLLAPAAMAAPVVQGPENGTLIIAGGGPMGPEIMSRFISLAGGPNANIVVIPTAQGDGKFDNNWPGLKMFRDAGAKHLTVLHTTDRKVADSEAFVAPLKKATGVWLVGGRQWHLVDSYLGTRSEAAIKDVLRRGGVVAGTSAGASIQASYLVRGARSGNEIMMAPGYEEGFGLLRGTAIDQHVTTRHRENDLNAVVEAHPDLLGIGLDQSTAIVVKRDSFEVIGDAHVFIHDGHPQPDGKLYSTLSHGDRFDLHRLVATTAAAHAGTP